MHIAHSVENREILSQRIFFRQISSLVKTLISRNFCQKSVRVNFLQNRVLWHSVEFAEILSHTIFAKISWKQWFC